MIKAETLRTEENANRIQVQITGSGSDIVDEWAAVCKGCIELIAEDGEFSDEELVSIIKMVVLQAIQGAVIKGETEKTDLC